MTVAQVGSLNVHLVGSYNTPGYARGGVVSGNYAYAADREAGLRIVDVTNPASPTEVGFHDTPSYAYSVTISGDYAYLTDGVAGLQVYQYTGGGVEETRIPLMADGSRPTATVIRGVLMIGDRGPKTGDRAELLDASGRKVLDLKTGANDVSRLAQGVYFVSERGTKNEESRTVKIIVQN